MAAIKQYIIRSSEIAPITDLASYANDNEILANALLILARSDVPFAVVLMRNAIATREPTQSQQQVDAIISSPEYLNALNDMRELANEERVEVTTVVHITKRHDAVIVGSTTTTTDTLPPHEFVGESFSKLFPYLETMLPQTQGIIMRKLKIESGILSGYTGVPQQRNYGERVVLEAMIDGYRNDCPVELRTRTKSFRIRSGWGFPKYDSLELGVKLYIANSKNIILEEYHQYESRWQTFTEEALFPIRGFSGKGLTLEDIVTLATTRLDDWSNQPDLFTAEVAKLAAEMIVPF